MVTALGMTAFLAYVAWGPDPPIVVANNNIQPTPKTYQVLPGDTIWSIYLEHYQEYDWEKIRREIGELNGLQNDIIRAYSVIKLPEVE